MKQVGEMSNTSVLPPVLVRRKANRHSCSSAPGAELPTFQTERRINPRRTGARASIPLHLDAYVPDFVIGVTTSLRSPTCE